MPLSPNIPTSFVPKQQVVQAPRHRSSGESLIMLISLIGLVAILAITGGVFGYDQYLKTVAVDKANEVQNIQKNISTDSVEGYVRARDRFSAAKSILDHHIAASQFLALLEQMTLQNVSFDSLHYVLNDDRSAKVTLTGTARTFNALAAQSSALSAQRSFKGTVFSDITTVKGGLVTFSMTTTVDPSLLVMETPAVVDTQPAAPVETAPAAATTTATSTTAVGSTTPTKTP